MTTAPAATSEMDPLDQLGPQAFDGFLGGKVLERRNSRRSPVPTHVVVF
jgi:hypothetical protein